MARKPVHLAQAGGKPQGRQAIWEEIRRQRDGFAVASIADATDIHPTTIRSYLTGLEAAGYIRRAVGGAPSWTLSRDIGVEAPRVTKDGKPVIQGSAREQMWRTMRMLSGDWSWRDLAIAASTEEAPVNPGDAADYCVNLCRAGYLHLVTPGKGTGNAGIPARYRFVRSKYTGPKPPMVQRVKSVYDPNLRRVVWFAGVRHDD
ncbi:MAG: hypothetical protein M0006_03465 [Magnetospirillum sp.]|nr:hypothetical protein [Magnetospirillum sp.]